MTATEATTCTVWALPCLNHRRVRVTTTTSAHTQTYTRKKEKKKKKAWDAAHQDFSSVQTCMWSRLHSPGKLLFLVQDYVTVCTVGGEAIDDGNVKSKQSDDVSSSVLENKTLLHCITEALEDSFVRIIHELDRSFVCVCDHRTGAGLCTETPNCHLPTLHIRWLPSDVWWRCRGNG